MSEGFIALTAHLVHRSIASKGMSVGFETDAKVHTVDDALLGVLLIEMVEDVDFSAIEEAGTKFAVCGQTKTIAVFTERAAHGRDEADFSKCIWDAVNVCGANSGFGVSVCWLQVGPVGLKLGENFCVRNDVLFPLLSVASEKGGFAKRHIFDKTNSPGMI